MVCMYIDTNVEYESRVEATGCVWYCGCFCSCDLKKKQFHKNHFCWGLFKKFKSLVKTVIEIEVEQKIV
jgi:hypothetical protein